MRAALLALLLALPASAEPPGPAALRARALLDALPAPARVELRKLYLRYADAVARRLDEGWKAGVLTEAVIEDVHVPFQPARLLEESLKNRRKEVADLEATLAKSGPERPDYGKTLRKIEDTKTSLAKLVEKSSREKGICRDWSDAVWWELTSRNPSHWILEDRRRQARPFHTGVLLCSSGTDGSHDVCLVFDPWEEGRADAFVFDTWDVRMQGGRIPADYFLHGLPEKEP